MPAFIQPCELYPPFNLIHTERLDNFSGDHAHAGWRRVIDVIARKIGRPGLTGYVAAAGAADRLWQWANEWPADPLAEDIWRARMDAVGEKERRQLEERREQLLRDGVKRRSPRVRLAEAPEAAHAEEAAQRAPRPHGLVRVVTLAVIAIMLVRLALVGTLGALPPESVLNVFGTSTLSPPLHVQILASALFCLLAGLAAWGSRWLLPRGAVRVPLWRGVLICLFGMLLLVAFTPLVLLIFLQNSAWGAPTLFVAAPILVPLAAAFEFAAVALAFIVGVVVMATPLSNMIGARPPASRERLWLAVPLALCFTLALVLYKPEHLGDRPPSLPDQVALALAQAGYRSPVVYSQEEGRESEIISASQAYWLESSFEVDLRAAIEFYERDRGLPITGEPTRALLEQLQALPEKRVWRVGQSAEADFATIAEALTRVSAGSQIELESGVFRERVALPHGVTLVGSYMEGRPSIIETVAGTPPAITLASQSTVMRLTIQRRHDVAAVQTDVFLEPERARISALQISDVGTAARTQPAISLGGSAEISDVTLSDIRGTAISSSLAEVDIQNVQIVNATDGLYLFGGGSVQDSTFREISGVAIRSEGSGAMSIENNDIVDSAAGFYAGGASVATFSNNRISRVSGTCAALLGASAAVIENNRISACGGGGYYPLYASAEARGRIENNVVLASGARIVHAESGSTAVIRGNRTSD